MSTKRMKRPAETVPVPQNREEAIVQLAAIGEITRSLTLLQAALDEEVAATKARIEAEAAPLNAALTRTTQGLQVWAEANRLALTDNGARKSVVLPSGEIGWRLRPPSVRVTDEPAVIAAAQAAGREDLLRVKTSINREAMLADPAAAMQLPGISIGSRGEEFIVTPLTEPMAPPAPAVQS
jgi:phage host-nuclease inhibitor protein Gam